MNVNPLIGTDPAGLLGNLQQAASRLANVKGAGGTVYDRYNAYLRWASESVRVLGGQVSSEDLSGLILTTRYWALQAMVTAPMGLAADLLDVEIDERLVELADTITVTERALQRWSGVQHIVVLDTSVYCQHPDKLENIDLAKSLGFGAHQLEIVFPIAVVDELDNLKRSRRNEVRWRAAYTLAVLYRVAGETGVGQLRKRGPIHERAEDAGEVWIDLLFDPPGHSRLPISDDEIVSRALSVQLLSGRPVTLVTFDTGQAMRAKRAGIERVEKLASQDQPQGAPRDSPI